MIASNVVSTLGADSCPLQEFVSLGRYLSMSNSPRWSARRGKCTGCIRPPSLPPGPLKEDGDSCPRVKTAPTIRQGKENYMKPMGYKTTLYRLDLPNQYLD